MDRRSACVIAGTDARDGLRRRRHARRAHRRLARWACPPDRDAPGDARPTGRGATRRTQRLRRPPGRLDQDVLPYVGHFDHPRFFGYIPGAGTWPAALGDLIAAATNIDAGSWRESVGPSTLELTVLDWFREWIDYPHSAAGVLGQRRLCREPDRDRVRARGADRAHVAAHRDVHRRPDALVRGPGGPPPRLPARPAPGPPDRRRLPPAPFRRRRGHRCRYRG